MSDELDRNKSEEEARAAGGGDAAAEEGPSSDVAAQLSAAEDLDAEAVARIQDEVAAYEEELRKEYRRASDKDVIRRKRRGYLGRLIERELEDAERPLEDVRAEEHVLIGLNFWLSLVVVVIFTIGAVSVGEGIEQVANTVSDFLTTRLSWFYILISALSLIFLAYLAFSRFGAVVLGEPDEEPEFDDLSWYSMLFSAGMGVGLLFNGGAEPIAHFSNPPIGEPGSLEAARRAMSYVNFHWGLNAWAIYTVCAVSVAYYGFRKRKKYLVSSSIVDLAENPAVETGIKVFTDLVATLAVVFGVAASLGMGVLQVAGGLQYCYGMDWAQGPYGLALILGSVTALFILSASTGLDKGIRLLSNLNMGVAVLLMLFVLFTGPTVFILKVFVDSFGEYIAELPRLCFKVAPWTQSYQDWMSEWTLPYFTWWIAWSPFVGIFIARISRGRTIRELIGGALIVPTIFSVFWFATFGGAALTLEQNTPGILSSLIPGQIEQALFAQLQSYPLHQLTWAISLLLIFTFLVTSADSACFVISMMTTEGDLEPSTRMKLLWGMVLAILTWTLLQGSGLTAIKAAALTFAFPFSLVMILMAISVRIRLSLQVEQRRI